MATSFAGMIYQITVSYSSESKTFSLKGDGTGSTNNFTIQVAPGVGMIALTASGTKFATTPVTWPNSALPNAVIQTVTSSQVNIIDLNVTDVETSYTFSIHTTNGTIDPTIVNADVGYGG